MGSSPIVGKWLFQRIVLVPAFVLRCRRVATAIMATMHTEAFGGGRRTALLMKGIVGIIRIDVHRALSRDQIGCALDRQRFLLVRIKGHHANGSSLRNRGGCVDVQVPG